MGHPRNGEVGVRLNPWVGKLLYALFFCGVLPTALALWARNSSRLVNLPMGPWRSVGWGVAVLGLTLMLAGMHHLIRFGKGLPMNAFPPERYVSRGVYRLFRHPIYTGFCLLCGGLAAALGSPSGLFLVTPVVALLCVALVLGHERRAMDSHFGTATHEVLFGLPAASDVQASLLERVCAALTVFVPWVLLYEMLIHFGTGSDFIPTTLPFEGRWPVWQAAEIPYALTYPFALLAPFFIGDKRRLRDFVAAGWWATGLGIFLQITLPLCAVPRLFEPHGALGAWIQWERALDGPAAAFPAFHVIWAFLAAAAYAKTFPSFKKGWYVLAVLMALSCVATGAHSVLDVAGGAGAFALVHFRNGIWSSLQRASEQLANSWREWHFGGFRVINHSLYPGLAGALGAIVAGTFIHDARAVALIATCNVVGGCLWGQFVEGSPRLLRPFGYYGAILGSAVGMVISVVAFGLSPLLLAAAFALAGPWVQAVGRLRCLVQGCCHGRVAEDGNGIRYVCEHSRVCLISDLKGLPLHNTQLYSVLSNVVIGLFLFRLWYGGAARPLIIGLYFILNGAARFAEEGYRGEAQTKIVAGLPIYQWFAALGVVLGAVVMTLPGIEGGTLPAQLPTTATLAAAIFAGLFSAFAMGMDFPGSNVRFSRLSG